MRYSAQGDVPASFVLGIELWIIKPDIYIIKNIKRRQTITERTNEITEAKNVLKPSGKMLTPRPSDIMKILDKRIERAVRNRMATVKVIEDLQNHGMQIKAVQFHKYTVCEIMFMNCYYHGLASRNPRDEPTVKGAFAISFGRAMNELFAKNMFGDLEIVKVMDRAGVVPVTQEIFAAMVRGAN